MLTITLTTTTRNGTIITKSQVDGDKQNIAYDLEVDGYVYDHGRGHYLKTVYDFVNGGTWTESVTLTEEDKIEGVASVASVAVEAEYCIWVLDGQNVQYPSYVLPRSKAYHKNMELRGRGIKTDIEIVTDEIRDLLKKRDAARLQAAAWAIGKTL